MSDKDLDRTLTGQGSERDGVNVASPKVDAFTERMNVAIQRAGGVTNMAKSIEASASVIRKWRSGESEPTRPYLVRMAKAADCSVAWLATGEEPVDAEKEAAEVGSGSIRPVDLDLLEEIVRVLRSQLEQRRLRLEPAGEARAVRLLYQIHSKRDDPVEADAVAEVINLAAHR